MIKTQKEIEEIVKALPEGCSLIVKESRFDRFGRCLFTMYWKTSYLPGAEYARQRADTENQEWLILDDNGLYFRAQCFFTQMRPYTKGGNVRIVNTKR
jgi:hypothetical protein